MRADPNGEVFRIALAQTTRIHQSASADRLAIDLVPDSFAGMPADLPPPPPKEAEAVDVAKLAPLKIRAGAYANYSRLIFDWPKNVPYAVFPGAGHLTIRFEAMARPDFSALENVAPPWVKEAGWRIENKGTVIEFTTDAQSGYHDTRDGAKIMLDILAPKGDASVRRPTRRTRTRPRPTTRRNDSVTGAQTKAIAAAAAQLSWRQARRRRRATPAAPPPPQTPVATDPCQSG